MDTFSFKAPVLLLVNGNAFEAAFLLGLFSGEVDVDEELLLSTKTGGYCSYSSKYGCLSDSAAVMRFLKSNLSIFWGWEREAN